MDRARQSVREAGFVFIAQRLQVSAPQVAGLKNQRLRQSACVCGKKGRFGIFIFFRAP